MRVRSLVGVLIVLVALAAACGGSEEGAREDASTTIADVSSSSSSATSTNTEGSEVALRPATAPVGEVRTLEVEVDGAVHEVRLYVPSTLPEGPVPLFLAFHGGGGWGEQFARTNGAEGLAEANGFLVAHPTGTPIPTMPGATWNGGYCCGPAARLDVDDVALVSEVIDAVAADHDVDPARTFAFGHSNGGILSYRLACELANRIVVIGAVGASLGVEGCDPAAPVSAIHLHGTEDTHHPLEGGVGPDSVAGVSFRPASEGVEALAEADGCPRAASSVAGDLTTTDWAPCAGGTAVRLVVIEGASHAWPGGSGPSLSGEPYADLDATATVVDFLLAHPRR